MRDAKYTPTLGEQVRLREDANIPDLVLGDYVGALRGERIAGTVKRVTAFGMVKVDFGECGTHWFHIGALEAAID